MGLLDFAENVLRTGTKMATFSESYKGEKHLLMHKGIGLKIANYTGPSTRIYKRLRLFDKGKGKKKSVPTTKSDEVSMMHDIRYTLAKSGKDVKYADRKMQRALTKILRKGQDDPRNVMMIKTIMGTKMLGEKLHLLSPEAFIEKDAKISPSERKLLMKHYKRLKKKGL
jgi:hypothetical protein